MHVVAVLALDGVSALGLTIPCQVFAFARRPDGSAAYEIRVCADRAVTTRAGEAEPFRLTAPYALADARGADTLIVPGSAADQTPHPRVVRLLREAAASGSRIASICTGAFVPARAGLLEGRRATTHWRFADDLAARYPDVTVGADLLVVPGGGYARRDSPGVWAEIQRGTLPKAQAVAARPGLTVSALCTGTMPLSAAGLTRNRPCTTHHRARQDLQDQGGVVKNARVGRR